MNKQAHKKYQNKRQQIQELALQIEIEHKELNEFGFEKEKELDEKEKEIELLKESLTIKKNENEELQLLANEVSDRNNQLYVQIEEAEIEQQRNLQEIQEMKRKINQLQDIKKNLEQINHIRNNSIENSCFLEQSNDEQKKQIEQNNLKIQNLKSEIQFMEKKLDDLLNKYKQLKMNEKNLKDLQKMLEMQKNKYAKQVQSLSMKNAQLSAQLQDMSAGLLKIKQEMKANKEPRQQLTLEQIAQILTPDEHDRKPRYKQQNSETSCKTFHLFQEYSFMNQTKATEFDAEINDTLSDSISFLSNSQVPINQLSYLQQSFNESNSVRAQQQKNLKSQLKHSISNQLANQQSSQSLKNSISQQQPQTQSQRQSSYQNKLQPLQTNKQNYQTTSQTQQTSTQHYTNNPKIQQNNIYNTPTKKQQSLPVKQQTKENDYNMQQQQQTQQEDVSQKMYFSQLMQQQQLNQLKQQRQQQQSTNTASQNEKTTVIKYNQNLVKGNSKYNTQKESIQKTSLTPTNYQNEQLYKIEEILDESPKKKNDSLFHSISRSDASTQKSSHHSIDDIQQHKLKEDYIINLNKNTQQRKKSYSTCTNILIGAGIVATAGFLYYKLKSKK